MKTTLEPALDIVRRVFGFKNFRTGQADIIQTVLEGSDVLAIMPTGGGKSLCFQLPALIRDGLTVVISPLIALMRDQVTQLQHYGIAAGSLNSTNSEAENERVLGLLREHKLRLLYLAPERLARHSTVELLNKSKVSLLAVDEAHCVSQWGHDFRPEYMEIGTLRKSLDDVQIIALTATADTATRHDMVARLFADKPEEFVLGFDRPNLFLAMQPKSTARKQLLNVVRRHTGESGIIYCSSRKRTENIAQFLNEQGFQSIVYHAGMDKQIRSFNQDRFLQEDGIIVVATIAFGMGIDKPDVRFVCHADLPKNVESYYQEVGRAGRDGLPAETLTLYGMDDIRLRRLQIEEGSASDDQKRVEIQRLSTLIALCEAPRCRRQTLLAYFGENSKACGNCDLCINKIEVTDGTIEAQKLMSAMLRTGQRFGTEHLISVLLGEQTDRIRQFGHQRLPTFGVGQKHSRNVWRTVLRQLYAAGHINMDIVNYGRWNITNSGAEILRGNSKFEMRKDVVSKSNRESLRSSRTATSPIGKLTDSEQRLLAALKELRLNLAQSENVPAYVIFQDRTLMELAHLQPETHVEMKNIFGIGDAKIEKYADEFLLLIKKYSS